MPEPTRENICRAFSEYARLMAENLEILGNTFPEEVREAYQTGIRVLEIMADPRIEDREFREVMFAEVPRERLEWVQDVLERWRTRDERRSAKRALQKVRRERNGGDLEERRLSAKKNQELYEKFETMRLLYAVDALDRVRPIISDQFNADGFPKPPELRDKLLDLHSKAHRIINEYECDTDSGMFDIAWDIEDEIYEAIRCLEDIANVINDLTELCPDECEDEDESIDE